MKNPLSSQVLLRRLRKIVLGLIIAVAIALPVRAYVLTPFRVVGDSVSPELPAGSRVLVYRLTSTYQPGDIVAYRQGENSFLGRCESSSATTLQVTRNAARAEVPREAVIGRVILNTR